MNYKLKSGQINFESLTNPGAFKCVTIKNGKFGNLDSETRVELVKLLQAHDCNEPKASVEDMF